jgi:hypothetical protein
MGSGGRLASDRWGALVLATLVTLAAGTHGAQAALPGYELMFGVGESDNVARSPRGPSATIVMEGADLAWHDQRPRFDTNIDADLQYLTYFPRQFHSEVVGNFLGNLRAALVPELLHWDLSDNFGQGRLDPLAPASPLNRENINYLSTGPDLLLPLTGTNFIDISAHYGNVIYQKSDLDSTRYSGRVGLIHQLSEAASVSLNLTDQRVDYKNDRLNVDYSSQDAFARFDARGVRTTLSVDLGYNRLRSSVFPQSAVLARLQISRKISGSSTVALAAGHQFSDAADAFVLSQTLGGANLATQSTTQTGVPFKSDYGTLGWNFQRNRTGFGLGASVYKDDYVQQGSVQLGAADDRRLLVDGHLSRLLSPTLTFLLGDEFYRQNFPNLGQHDTENDVNAELSWRASRSITLAASVIHSNRHSDIPNTDFTENRLWLSISYGRPAQLPPGPPPPRLPNQKLN